MNRREVLGVSMAVALASNRVLAQSSPRPILVIGATARSGPELLKQALAQGRRVTALARSPEKITVSGPGLTAVKGDVYDIDSLAAAMTGEEAVVSLVGPRVTDHTKEIGFIDLYSVGTATIISAMRRRGNKRLIAVSSGGPEKIPSEKPTVVGTVETWLWNARNLYGDMQRMEKIIAVSGLETVILRARNFGEGPKLDNLKLKVHDNYTDFDQYKDKSKRTPGAGSRVTYADFAALILSVIEGDRFLGKSVGVYSDVLSTASFDD
jgi:putative NADH-flavin reductase